MIAYEAINHSKSFRNAQSNLGEILPSLYEKRGIEDLVELGVSASVVTAVEVVVSGSGSAAGEVVPCLSE